MDLPFFLNFSSAIAEQYKYALVFIGVIVEGPILMIACGFLYRLGVFDLPLLFLTLVIGDLLADIGWYYVGFFFAKPFLTRYGKLFGFTEEHITKVKDLFHLYKNRILLLSKVTIGLGLAILIILFAGMSKISMKTFLLFNAIGEIIIVGALLAFGYFLGHLYSYIDKGYQIFTLFLMITFVIIFLYEFSKYTKNKILNTKL